MNLISQDYLMHHGVKGMKWGVRKDRTAFSKSKGGADGYLTKEEKLRYKKKPSSFDK